MSSERNDTETPRQASEPGEQPEQPEPAEDILLVTDPKTIRAMAHPLRLAILELFAVQETLTATQASEALGESPANCAFHLRTLAKYGVIEEAGGGRGRERPWKEVSGTIRLNTASLKDKQAELAATALGQVTLDRWLARIRSAYFNRDWPADWGDATSAQASVVYLTPTEMDAIGEQIRLIFAPFISRRKDPSVRPAGSLPVEFDVFAYLRQDLAALVPDADENGTDDHEPASES